MEWQGAADVLAWVEASRLNLVKDLDQSPTRPQSQTCKAGS